MPKAEYRKAVTSSFSCEYDHLILLSSTVARILQIGPIAEIFQAMSMNLSAAAICVCQSPMHKPNTEMKSKMILQQTENQIN